MKTCGMVSTTLVLTLAIGGCTALKRFAYEGFGRDRWQHPDRVIETLDLRPGQSIVDLGAGGGYFTFRLADAVKPGGEVHAVDIDRDMLAYLEEQASKNEYGNVETILAAPDDPRLPEDGVDLIFTCNTYHHLADRVSYFTRARPSLREGGRVAIVEYAGKGWLSKLFGHFTPPEDIRREMEAAGYVLAEEHDFLPRQSFLVFAVEPG